jgi:hypothetical protein
MARVHIGRRTGEQHAIGVVEQLIDFRGMHEWHDQWQATGQANRVDIFLPRNVEGVQPDHAIAGGDQDNRLTHR